MSMDIKKYIQRSKEMKKVHLVMPMGGAGTRFFHNGYESPKPLIEIHGKPFFFWATQSVLKSISVSSITFVILQEHIDKFNIKEIISSYYPEAKFKIIPQVLNGAVLTCKEGVQELPENEGIIFNDCDHLFYASALKEIFLTEAWSDVHGGLLTFHSNDKKFSFLSLDQNGFVNKTVEKEVISNHAICGVYYFQNKDIFVKSTDLYLQECAYHEFFVSGVYNTMIQQGLKIQHCTLDKHVSFGTPEEYELALQENNQFLGLL